MSSKAVYRAIYPIGDSDPRQMPVANLEQAIKYYEGLGFQTKTRSSDPYPSAVIARDEVEIGLAVNGGDPQQASCYIAVDNVELARQELLDQQRDVSDLRLDRMGDSTFRVFFLRDDEGLCFCLGTKVS
ncbi:MAG: VOC family protein [Anaerolineae bacterium]|nr:VOC family protein [Anaerolineae bacterium]